MANTTEKDLELEDEFIEEEEAVSIDIPAFAGSDPESSASEFWEKYKTVIIGVFVGTVVLVGGYLFYQSQSESQETEAQEQMIQAFKWYEQDSLDKAIKGTSQNPGLEKFVDEYGSSKAGNMGKYMLGTAYLAKGKLDNGITQLEDFTTREDMVSASACAALAYAYEEKNDFNAAANQYIKASEINQNTFTSPDFLFQAARCYELAKDNEKALKLYKDIKKKYPLSEAGRKADKYIAKLSTE